MSRRLTALPRIRRDPASLRKAIARKREQRQSTARLQSELNCAVAAQIRREVRETGVAK